MPRQKKTKPQQQQFCACGICGEYIPPTDVYGRLHKFKRGHNFWKGDNVGYHAVHRWVRSHLPPPDRCQICDKIGLVELVNVTGKYTRDFNNWAYDCHKCHNIIDKMIDMSNRKCSVCGTDKTYIIKHRKGNRTPGRPVWRYSQLTKELLCSSCWYKENDKIRNNKINV